MRYRFTAFRLTASVVEAIEPERGQLFQIVVHRLLVCIAASRAIRLAYVAIAVHRLHVRCGFGLGALGLNGPCGRLRSLLSRCGNYGWQCRVLRHPWLLAIRGG